ncbi:entry exclusion protein 1 [Salmonella enterica subsp. enterica serovar Braenderup]|uniref:entry exclusion protein 1 n=1 Tax=Pectobacterium TaxID=122277 RepID=UPI0025A09DEE|nr:MULTISPECIES: entry exclusion protein 1 [Pectobacterium]WJM81043.1 entry exclusion protein 1 [Pectobacterium brasiliense]
MAWVSVRQAMELTGKGRSSLYRDMAKGRVSYRSESDGGRSLDTSELMRVYGELKPDETTQWDTRGQGDETDNSVMKDLVLELKALREEVSGLKLELQEMRRLEYKPAPVESENVHPKPWWRRWLG